MKDYIISLSIVLSVAIIAGCTLYGCTESNKSYYDLANKCIDSNGSWIPGTGPNSSTGVCIHGKFHMLF